MICCFNFLGILSTIRCSFKILWTVFRHSTFWDSFIYFIYCHPWQLIYRNIPSSIVSDGLQWWLGFYFTEIHPFSMNWNFFQSSFYNSDVACFKPELLYINTFSAVNALISHHNGNIQRMPVTSREDSWFFFFPLLLPKFLL